MTRIAPSPRRSVRLVGVLGLAGSLVAVALAVQWVGAQETTRRRTTEPDLNSVDKKLEQILTKQDEILKRLDAMTEELQIVKVRCTR